ncbi:MAG: dienelactone hydrolase family protein [Planctomycetaceae bacterium]|nr:dienelactone hydrolase family protein [Planctomycetaceae bacterium]
MSAKVKRSSKLPGLYHTPQELWDGIDPRAEELDVETLRRWREGGAAFHEFYFTSETYRGAPCRIYAIYSAPVGARRRRFTAEFAENAEGREEKNNTSAVSASSAVKLPAVLHIHGGGQTVSIDWLKFWNARGYAAMTYNWGGWWENRPRYALWGKLTQGNHQKARQKIEAVWPSPRESSWFHWTLAGRRALTVLERQKEVDPNRIGIFGVSMGGTLTWTIAGTDPRVRAACAIYGVGWTTYPTSMHEADPHAADVDKQIWRSTMEPEAYAPLVRCPVLYLDGSNDFYGKMDWAYQTLGRAGGIWRAAFSPRVNHHIAEDEGTNLPLWMDWHLKGGPAAPATPEAQVTLDARGVPQLEIRPDRSQTVARIDAYYALHNADPKNRHWRSAAVVRKGGKVTASLPVLDASQRLFAYAQVHYESGWHLASNFQAVVPAELGAARATDKASRQIGDFSKGLDDFCTCTTGTDPIAFAKGLKRVKGPAGRWGVQMTMWSPLYCRKLADPKWHAPAGAELAFDVFTRQDVTLKLSLLAHQFSPGATTHRVLVPLKAAGGWQSVRLPARRFKDDKKQPMRSWRELELLEVAFEQIPQRQPLFSNFRWA